MKKVSFSERLQQGLDYANMTQIELSKVTGISKSAISQYISGAFAPKQDRTYIIAQALGVPEAWLMGYDVPIKKEEPPEGGKSELINMIIRELAALPTDKQQDVLRYIRFLRNG